MKQTHILLPEPSHWPHSAPPQCFWVTFYVTGLFPKIPFLWGVPCSIFNFQPLSQLLVFSWTELMLPTLCLIFLDSYVTLLILAPSGHYWSSACMNYKFELVRTMLVNSMSSRLCAVVTFSLYLFFLKLVKSPEYKSHKPRHTLRKLKPTATVNL